MTQSQPLTDTNARLYDMLRLIRRVEEEIARIYPSDKIKSPVHLSIGQEYVSVAICDLLKSEDALSMTYRGHAAYLAKGGDLKKMMAELYGKATGGGVGKSGSMHLVDMDQNILGASAVVGTGIPVGVGFGLAKKMENKGEIVVVFLGDGATEEGVFSESLNFAALKKLPVLFVVENNGLAIHTSSEKRAATNRLCERVETYGIPTRRTETSDVHDVRSVAAELIDDIRSGKGPAMMECMTYRWYEHVGPNEDYDDGYRDRSELIPWMEQDALIKAGDLLDPETRATLDAEVEQRISDAVNFAEQSPFPKEKELYSHVYAD